VRRAARLPLEQLQPYLLDLPSLRSRREGSVSDRRSLVGQIANLPSSTAGQRPAPPSPVAHAPGSPQDLTAVFGNDHPVELEVGFGKGLFLLTVAQQRPEVNFVGIEIERKYFLFTANRLAKRGLANVRLICGDARVVLSDFIPAGSLQAVHVYFPDPWWKTRHRKRRVFTGEFARQCERILRPGGCLSLATDVNEYFTLITDLVVRETALVLVPPPEIKEPEHDLDYLTNFERKYRRAGKPIYRAVYGKASG
jgi:tRNA (guanine-N7-)-methyltransferase